MRRGDGMCDGCSACLSCAGTAYVHGMKHARGNFVILMDADLSHHVSSQRWQPP